MQMLKSIISNLNVSNMKRENVIEQMHHLIDYFRVDDS